MKKKTAYTQCTLNHVDSSKTSMHVKRHSRKFIKFDFGVRVTLTEEQNTAYSKLVNVMMHNDKWVFTNVLVSGYIYSIIHVDSKLIQYKFNTSSRSDAIHSHDVLPYEMDMLRWLYNEVFNTNKK